MVKLNLSHIPNDAICAVVREVATEQLNTENIEFEVEAAAKPGDNYSGFLYRVTYKKLDKNELSNGNRSESKMVIKVAPLTNRDCFLLRPNFLREMYLYEEVIIIIIII